MSQLTRCEELAIVARMAQLADRVGVTFVMSIIFVVGGVVAAAVELRAVLQHDAAILVGIAVGIVLLMLAILCFSRWSLLVISACLLVLVAGGFTIMYKSTPRLAFPMMLLASSALTSLFGSVMTLVMHWKLNAAIRDSRLSWRDCRRLTMAWFGFGGRHWASRQNWSRPWLATPEKTAQVYFTLLDEEMIVNVGRDRGLGTNLWFSGRNPANFVRCPAEPGKTAFVVTFTDMTGTLLVRADEGETIRAWVERQSSPPETFSLSAYREFRAMALAFGSKGYSTLNST